MLSLKTSEFETEKASVEDIMLYYLKRGERI